jgi:signal transduction histidine kinase
VHLEVHDDGVGFDPSSLTGKVSSVGGLGLSQMRERLEGRGGQFKFSSTLGEGTRIMAQIT